MQKLFLSIAIILLCVYTTLAQQAAPLIAIAETNEANYRSAVLTIPANIVYTKNIHTLPEEAMLYCEAFAKRKNYITDIYKRGKAFFPKVNKIFAKHNLPTELNVLLAIESYFKKDLVSTAGAVGYWQFMDATAVEYGLSIDSAKDERKDFTKSTKAAAKYLKAHYAVLKDWYLTVASYNCGLGNVKKAIAKSGLPNPSFFQLKNYLPKETQNYVLKYIGLNILFKNYASFISNKLQWYEITQQIKQPIEPPTITAASLDR